MNNGPGSPVEEKSLEEPGAVGLEPYSRWPKEGRRSIKIRATVVHFACVFATWTFF